MGAFTCVLILATAAPGSGAAVDPAAVTLPDLISLLKAGVGESVILRQVSLAGTSVRIGVEEILELKDAGASDGLIEALMAAQLAGDLSRGDRPAAAEARALSPDPSPAPSAIPSLERESPSFRIYTELTDDGEEILHVTNLDSSGRRMGGEPVSRGPVPVNQYRTRDEAPGDYDDATDAYEPVRIASDPEERVVVNVYPPAPQNGVVQPVVPVAIDAYGSPYMHRDPYAYLYPRGRLPGYYGVGHRYARRGHHYRPAPPGSYTHFVTYHGGTTRMHGGTQGLPVYRPGYYPSHRGSSAVRGFDFIGPAQARATLHRMRSGVGVKR